MKKIISKLGLAISAFAIVFGALSLSSCQKEEIEYNKDIPGGQIVIPGTDITSIEQLLSQIKDYLAKEQKAQLDELIAQIAGDNEDIKAQLEAIVEQIKEGQKTDAEIKALLEKIIKHLEDEHKTDPHSDPHSDPHGDPHGHGEGSNAGGGATGK